MKSQQTLFVCEFITGGGFVGSVLPESLAQEGLLMRDALLRDLAELPDWRLVSTYDRRVPPPLAVVQSTVVDDATDVWAVWRTCMAEADAVWVIAPETDGILYRLAEMARDVGVRWIGPGLNAIQVTTDKYLAAQTFTRVGLPSIPTYVFAEWQPDAEIAWLVKPNDGAGCTATYVFSHTAALQAWFAQDTQRQHTHVIQPYMAGTPASICVLGLPDGALLLSCNLQSILLQEGTLTYTGGVINGAAEYWAQLSQLVIRMKAAIPSLEGYFGVDVLLNTNAAGGITMVEINPRLTTSYAYLRQAMRCNPAAMILDAMCLPVFTPPVIKRELIEFYV